MTAPIELGEDLVDAWFAALDRAGRPIPEVLRHRWHDEMLAAVREARTPPPPMAVGRFAALDRYFTGVASGVAAALGTSPASFGADSDAVVLAAGLLAGSAAVAVSQTEPGDRAEASVAAAAATGAVDRAAGAGELGPVILEAVRAAGQVRRHTMVGIALQALGRAIAPPVPATGTVFDVQLVLDPVVPGADLDLFALDDVVGDLALACDWVPTPAGFRLLIRTERPGPLLEALWSHGRVSELSIDVEDN
jgi:hypothetical protein